MNVWTNLVMRVGPSDGDGACLEVGPDGDCPGWVHISTETEVSTQWFGDIGFNVTPDTARALAVALVKVADSMDETNKP